MNGNRNEAMNGNEKSGPKSPLGAFALLALLAFCAVGCDSTPSGEVAATWHKDARPGLEKWCGSCHVPGGAGPFDLLSAGAAKQMVNASINAIETGTMPPYRANDDCRPYRGQWMNDSQAAELVKALKSWRDGGFAEGDATTYIAPELPPNVLKEAGPADITLKAETPYTPNDKVSDDYRCFVLPKVFDKETFLKMSDVKPHQRELVHHVLVYVVPANFLAALHKLDELDGGIGYECFGGPGVGSPSPVAGWAPGDAPAMTPDGVAQRIPAGSKLVMQVHYNLAAPAKADQTELQLWTTDDKPAFLLKSKPMPNFGIKIAAGDKSSTHTKLFKNKDDKAWTIIATTPHMHTFGTKIAVHRVAADGKRECVVDVQNWDFNWQLSYPFLTDKPVVVQPGESLELTCVYDNTAANQPTVKGSKVSPKLLTWGEGTLDEMCLNYLAVIEPYAPVDDTTAVCDGFDLCFPDCRKTKEFGTCLLECGGKAGGKCQTCVYSAAIQCGLSGSCVSDTAPLYDCIQDCGSQGGCIFSQCTSQIDQFQTCIGPQVDQGKCGPQLEGCGIKL